jgi:saccharopine dehydrogenase-like NADP-dependent oxidoreductase
MEKKIIVLGVGLVGSAIAKDLNLDYQVTAVDINKLALKNLSQNFGIPTIEFDLSKTEKIGNLVANYDLVICAVPGFMGFKTLKAIIEAGKNVVDISFFAENPFELDNLAKKHQVTAVVDAGIAPGLGNVILGYHNKQMKVESFRCLVGGLPQKREWPYEYKAVFSPIDVIEEYVRPARYVQNGQLIVREALSDAELIHFDEVGTLEAWNSDGLRTLAVTMNIPNMIEKTLRYPGTIQYLKVLRETGFFSNQDIQINGNSVKPIDLTAKLLFEKWKLKEGEGDFTIMQIDIIGTENEQKVHYIYNLYDIYDAESKTISMARTTGYTCTAIANLLITNKFDRKGICPPEYVGEQADSMNFIINYLKNRNVNLKLIYKV